MRTPSSVRIGLHTTGKYRDRGMQHTCSRHVAWDLHMEFEQRQELVPRAFYTLQGYLARKKHPLLELYRRTMPRSLWWS
jgi:hypothetical protein